MRHLVPEVNKTLKPCPFCGAPGYVTGEAMLTGTSAFPPYWIEADHKDGCYLAAYENEPPFMCEEELDDAARRWNTRLTVTKR